ncbi:Chitin deacetylase-like protein 9 [Colletotrichum chlorophyti]|uniref:Chitin deacetylase-like protein 9 n=1 Tax=Colletotrichum chlorophyti TaxID=708187 RepID=A0A1Q8RHA8_9PEZI|nr:Chitin deacetylase-like protein 9 [Colletotrichum chlorophyti]
MHWISVLFAALAGLEAVQAHDDGPHMNFVMPRRRSVDELRQRRPNYEPWNPPSAPNKPRDERRNRLDPRQVSATIQLGDNVHWCGQGTEYCRAPDCQINYGPACDGNQKPNGPDTANYARPLNGDIPYGGLGIYACNNEGDVAITYDDGPYIYTAAMLDAFKARSAVATWYITGNNIGKGQINVAYRDVIQRMIADGHQIASHTWSHENLDQMTLEQRKNQMVYNEIAFMDILGFFPTYMRPPFSICGTECQNQMVELGYHITYFDLDTEGYLHTLPSQIQTSIDIWDAAMVARSPCNGSYLHIEHDIHQQVATTWTNHMLDSVVKNGWRAVTVGECLGDPPENWYRGAVPGYSFNITAVSPVACTATPSSTSSSSRSTSSTATSATPTSTVLPVSDDGQCGPTVRKTCLGSSLGNCCSNRGWCGNSALHCGTGCQSQYGTCGLQSSSSISATRASSTSRSTTRSGTASAPTSTSTLPVSNNGQCGSQVNRQCFGYSGGNCCSQYNFCGSSDAHCGNGCQSAFGICNNAANSASSRSGSTTRTGSTSAGRSATASSSGVAPSSSLVSTNGECGAKNGRSCLGSTFGNCCSQYDFCGSTDAHCGNGCKAQFGNCTNSASGASTASRATSVATSATRTASSPASTNTQVSINGACGAAAGNVNCLGSTFGDCCSPYNYCGNTTAHCDAGCQSDFGRCSGAGADLRVSLNGACGSSANGATCAGSTFGNCCSQYGYCGSSTAHCGTGCQSTYGSCGMYSWEGRSSRAVQLDAGHANS